MTDFLLPTLGENIQTADVIRVLVTIGQVIKKDEPILELETAKAVFELPAPQDATVKEILVKAGDKVKVGQLVLKFEGVHLSEMSAPIAKELSTKAEVEKNREDKITKKEVSISATVVSELLPNDKSFFASPLVRRLAREKGIDLSLVQASGPQGRILPEDLEKPLASLQTKIVQSASSSLAQIPLPDFSKWGIIERKAMSQLRLAASKNLTQSWTTIPHVTQCEDADITQIETWRKSQKQKITMSAVLIKILANLLEQFPQFNSSVDLASEEIIYKKYKHIGVAVDTERGLVVPVLRDIDKKDVFQIGEELKEASEKARAKKLKLEDMQGACMTLSNLGGIGGTYFTPIVNWPEVAILGVCQGRLQPRWMNNGVVPRLIMPLSLSYDHRVIDGADGIRFLKTLVESLEKGSV